MPAYQAPLSRRRFIGLLARAAFAPFVAPACRGGADPTLTVPAATAQNPTDPRTATLTRRPTPTPAASPSKQPSVAETNPSALPPPVQQVLAVAAREHDVPVEDVILVSFTERDWPSPALGCPEEGRLYPQIVTPGYLVIVAIETLQHEYHTDSRMGIISC